MADSDATIREVEWNAERTVREASPPGQAIDLRKFRDYTILRQLPTSGGESDIYVVGKSAENFILKLYRYKVEPNAEVINRIAAMGAAHPRALIRVFEFGFDEATRRWFEIQEYAQNGSLKNVVDNIAQIGEDWRSAIFYYLLSEVSESLRLLHGNGILHLDLKPANVLVRSWDPIDFALIDFGISNTLAPELSKKFTAVRGTPMYQSPESWSGAVGESSDWWSLGMMALEIACGKHPFAGLSQQVIASLLMTKAVDIPETLSSGEMEVLRGLLTRDTSRRWGYEQVSMWLGGKRDIPVYFEDLVPENAPVPPARGSSLAHPRELSFMGEKHSRLDTLVRAIARDELAWAKGRELLMCGNIRVWLESCGEYEQAVDVDLLLEGADDPDEKLFRLVHSFSSPLPFIFMGRVVTLNNMILFLGRNLAGEGQPAAEAALVEKLCGGRLLPVLDFYLLHNETSPELEELKRVFARIQGETPRSAFDYLDAIAGVKKNLPMDRFAELRESGAMDEIEAALLHAVKDSSGNTALVYAASGGASSEAVAALLEAGEDVNATNQYGVTPLMAAVRNNAPADVVSLLLASGADANAAYKSGGTALILAAGFHGDPGVITALLDAGADVNAADERGVTALLSAAQNNADPRIARVLIDAGADVNAAENVSGETALMKAVRENGSLEVMAALIAAGVNVNAVDKDDVTALMAAARNNEDPRVVSALLDAGADVNDVMGRSGVTALMGAAQSNHNPEVVTILLDRGAYVNAMNEFGVTALMAAAQSNANPMVAAALLAAGADVNVKDKRGSTALMKAAQWSGNPEVVAVLLAGGAYAGAMDKAGKSAAYYAARNNDIKGSNAYERLLGTL